MKSVPRTPTLPVGVLMVYSPASFFTKERILPKKVGAPCHGYHSGQGSVYSQFGLCGQNKRAFIGHLQGKAALFSGDQGIAVKEW